MHALYYFCAFGRDKTFCELFTVTHTHTYYIYHIHTSLYHPRCREFFFVSYTISKYKPKTVYRNVRVQARLRRRFPPSFIYIEPGASLFRIDHSKLNTHTHTHAYTHLQGYIIRKHLGMCVCVVRHTRAVSANFGLITPRAAFNFPRRV